MPMVRHLLAGALLGVVVVAEFVFPKLAIEWPVDEVGRRREVEVDLAGQVGQVWVLERVLIVHTLRIDHLKANDFRTADEILKGVCPTSHFSEHELSCAPFELVMVFFDDLLEQHADGVPPLEFLRLNQFQFLLHEVHVRNNSTDVFIAEQF